MLHTNKRAILSPKQKFNFSTKNNIWFYTFLALFIKSILFICLLPDKDAAIPRIWGSFYNIPSFLVFSCFITAFLSFSFLAKGRSRISFLITFNLIVSFIIIGDLWNYRAFGNFLSIHALEQTSNLENLSSSIMSMTRPIDILFLADIFVISFISIKNKYIYKNKKVNLSMFIISLIISVGYITFAHYRVDVWGQGKNDILFRICWSPNQTMSNLSPIGYHIFDSYQYWKDSQPLTLTEKEKKEINNWFSDKKEALPDNKYSSMFKGKNLLVIQVESLETFVIGKKINGQEITPNLNKLLSNSLYFPNYYEQVYNGTSSDSDLLTNTSVYPVRRGTTFFRYPKNEFVSLPKLMKKNGYYTSAIHPDKGAYWNWMEALDSMGFDKCIDSSYYKMDEKIGLGISDGSYFKQIEPIIAKQKQPFYSFVVTLTSHSPFDLPKKYRELNLESYLDESKLGGYFQSIHYTDKQLGKFLSKLEGDGSLENTVVALYGDHCGVHKFYQKEVEAVKPSEDWWIDNENKIPLIIYEKSLKETEIKTIGGQVDLMPTLCYLMGIDKKDYIDSAMGRNLLNTNKNFVVLSNRTYIGTSQSEDEKNKAIEGIDLADKIIESNYFKK